MVTDLLRGDYRHRGAGAPCAGDYRAQQCGHDRAVSARTADGGQSEISRRIGRRERMSITVVVHSNRAVDGETEHGHIAIERG